MKPACSRPAPQPGDVAVARRGAVVVPAGPVVVVPEQVAPAGEPAHECGRPRMFDRAAAGRVLGRQGVPSSCRRRGCRRRRRSRRRCGRYGRGCRRPAPRGCARRRSGRRVPAAPHSPPEGSPRGPPRDRSRGGCSHCAERRLRCGPQSPRRSDPPWQADVGGPAVDDRLAHPPPKHHLAPVTAGHSSPCWAAVVLMRNCGWRRFLPYLSLESP